MAASSTQSSSHRGILWGMRLFFFTLTGSGAMLMPFLPLFYREHGLSGTEIGLLGTITSIASLVSAPLWGRLSDRAARPRLVLQSALLLAGLCLLLLSRQAVFGGFALVVAVYALLNSGIEPISNRLALQVVERSGQGGFGSIRLWGSLGWAVMVLASGWLVEYTGSLLTAFIGAVLLQAVSILALNRIHIGSAASAAHASSEQPHEGTRGMLRRLAGSRLMLALAAALVLQWLVLGGLYGFQGIYLQQLGAGEGLIGVAWMVSAAVELPGMWWTDRLIRRFGAARVLALAFLLEAARTIPVLIWPSVPAIIAAEVITGLAYSFLWVGMVVFINNLGADRGATTLMALYTVTLPALTQMVSGPFSGFVFDRFGAYWLYAIALAGSLLAWAVLSLANKKEASSIPLMSRR